MLTIRDKEQSIKQLILEGAPRMSVIKPEDLVRRRREVLEALLRDLSPGLREEARRILEELPLDVLLDKRRALEELRRRGLVI